MTAPTTLRAVSGLSNEPPSLTGSALIMIDLQNTYREGVMKLSGVEEAIVEAQKLLRRARDAGTPVYHVQHDAGTGSPYDLDDRLGAISEQVAPRHGEPVIVKNYPSAFVGTDLKAQLEAAGVKNLILSGFMTHMCVNSTARSAFSFGFQPPVVAAATAPRSLPGIDGSVVPAEAVQAASLAALADLFAVVVPRERDIRS